MNFYSVIENTILIILFGGFFLISLILIIFSARMVQRLNIKNDWFLIFFLIIIFLTSVIPFGKEGPLINYTRSSFGFVKKKVYEKVWSFQQENPTAIDSLAEQGAACIDSNAQWICGARSKEIYDALRGWNGRYVTNALSRKILDSRIRLQVLFLAVKLGIERSEQQLVSVLMNQGDKTMAEDFLNSGSRELSESAKTWARTHGYEVAPGSGSHRLDWGEY